MQRDLATVIENQQWQNQQIERIDLYTTSLQEQIECLQERCFDLACKFDSQMAANFDDEGFQLQMSSSPAGPSPPEQDMGETASPEVGGRKSEPAQAPVRMPNAAEDASQFRSSPSGPTGPSGGAGASRGGGFPGGPGAAPDRMHSPIVPFDGVDFLVPGEYRTPTVPSSSESVVPPAVPYYAGQPPAAAQANSCHRVEGGETRPPCEQGPVAAAAPPTASSHGHACAGTAEFDIPSVELNLLIKMLPTVKLVSFHDVSSGPKAQRLNMWRAQNRTALSATRGVVVSWWDSLWAKADPLYRQWAQSLPSERILVQCPADIPAAYAWIDQYMRPRMFDLMPKRVQSKLRAEEQFGPTRTCAQMLFALLQDQGPGDLQDIDEVSRHVRCPNPCSDPAAALTELRRWWASLQRLKELQVALPDTRALSRMPFNL